jgi:hypothetical protein
LEQVDSLMSLMIVVHRWYGCANLIVSRCARDPAAKLKPNAGECN